MIKVYEKFTESDYLKRKQKKEKKLTQKMGEHYIIDIVAEGDFEGLKYLQDRGFSLANCDVFENLLTIALKNNQMEMLDYLLNKSDYFDNAGWEKELPINSIHIPDLIGEKKYDGTNKATPEAIEWLKTITKLGFNFGGSHNLIELYLCQLKNGKEELIDGIEPFIDWLLENYPENYSLCKDVLPENLKLKYKYLEESNKYNL